MSQPSFPNITPLISITLGQVAPLLLGTIALEELALAHIINAEAEKIQFVLGTLTPTSSTLTPSTVTVSNLLSINKDVRRTLQDVIKKEMLLQFKFENVLDLITSVTGAATLIFSPLTVAGGLCGIPIPITGKLVDALGTPIAGATVNLAITNTTGTAKVTLSSTTSITDVNGNFSVLGTFSGMGTVTITAFTTINGVTISTSQTISVTCPSPSS
jgi:hypothetical protein